MVVRGKSMGLHDNRQRGATIVRRRVVKKRVQSSPIEVL